MTISLSSPRAPTSAPGNDLQRLFGIDPKTRRRSLGPAPITLAGRTVSLPSSGELMWITGPSGSGKSTLLRRLLRSDSCARFVNLRAFRSRSGRPIDCFEGATTDQALSMLACVGLGEAGLFLRKARHLSEGQQFRLSLAVGLWQARGTADAVNPRAVLVCDEFAASLDRVSACVVSRVVRTFVDRQAHVSALLVSSRDDLAGALSPDVVVTCDFGSVRTRRRRKPQKPPAGEPASGSATGC